ncbi:GNAT family N-acetyltransferase [Amycolatopsis sp. NPDC059027]|uniref:GNAT family N-acetyltransferase n=1 Tax=Amycolatopsis sp. NPDC059027 TaxID=3346709 RepID=UPI00366DB9BF
METTRSNGTTSAGITISRAVPEQTETLTTLMHASSAYRGDYASILDGYAVTAAYVRSHPVFVATSADRIVGFAALLTDNPELDLLFVADDTQGLGVGARLVAHVLEHAKTLGIATVRVVAHPPALAFYERRGARRVGTVPPKPPKITWERPELVFELTRSGERDNQRTHRE